MTPMLKTVGIATLAGYLLWAQAPVPTATIAQDLTTGQITAVVSTSKANRLVCKYSPEPAGPPGTVFTALDINCAINSKSPIEYAQIPNFFQLGAQGETFAINANGNMNITAIFTPVFAVAPGTNNQIAYQIVANMTVSTGVFAPSNATAQFLNEGVFAPATIGHFGLATTQNAPQGVSVTPPGTVPGTAVLHREGAYWETRDGRRLGVDCNPCVQGPAPGYKVAFEPWLSMTGACSPRGVDGKSTPLPSCFTALPVKPAH
jgi:hypothetical protein